ncbi:MAG: hypothetical protein KDC92_02680 [Bacteroidetes bacterium]|nr:hypothetical protein [Bacteroidota bacterium]
MNMLLNFPSNVQYFSFVNYNRSQPGNDVESYYSEHHVRWAAFKSLPIDLSQLWVNMSGSGNNNLKYGIRWKWYETPVMCSVLKNSHLFFALNFHLFEFAPQQNATFLTQIEYVYNLKIFPKQLKNRLYLSGFADQNLEGNGSFKSKWVHEHQIGFKLYKSWYAVAEFRVNQYLPFGYKGWGFGIEYLANFL